MPHIDKTKPAADWTPDQIYIYQERLGIIGDSLPMSPSTGQPLYRISDYVRAWDEADGWK